MQRSIAYDFIVRMSNENVQQLKILGAEFFFRDSRPTRIECFSPCVKSLMLAPCRLLAIITYSVNY